MITEYIPTLNLYKNKFIIIFIALIFLYPGILLNNSIFIYAFLISTWQSSVYGNESYKLLFSIPISRKILFNTIYLLSLLVALTPAISYIILTLLGRDIDSLLLFQVLYFNLVTLSLFTFAYSKITKTSIISIVIFLLSLAICLVINTLVENGIINLTFCIVILSILLPSTYLISLKSFKSRSIL